MEIQVWGLVILGLIVLLLGGMLIVTLVALIPFINQLKMTAKQLEITASSLDNVINHEVKAILDRGEKVLEDWEKEIEPIIKEKVRHIPSATAQFAFSEFGGRLIRVFIMWALREFWGKIRGRGKRN